MSKIYRYLDYDLNELEDVYEPESKPSMKSRGHMKEEDDLSAPKISAKRSKRPRIEEYNEDGDSQNIADSGSDVAPVTLASVSGQSKSVFHSSRQATSPSPSSTASSLAASSHPHQFGPNTHEIRGFKIDMDGVLAISKVQSKYNGLDSFGITFLFKGSKGLSRTIWFGRNVYERDRIYQQENSFWESLQSPRG